MHELTKRQKKSFASIGGHLSDQELSVFDKVNRAWLEEKSRELFKRCGSVGDNMCNAKKMLGLTPKTLEEKVDDWFEESDGRYPSGKAWRVGCKENMKRILREHKDNA